MKPIRLQSHYPRQIEFRYLAIIRKILKDYHVIVLNSLEHNLATILRKDDNNNNNITDVVNNDDWYDRLQALLFGITVFQGSNTTSHNAAILSVASAVKDVAQRNFRRAANVSLGVEILGGESSRKLVDRWASENVKLITKMVDEEKQAIGKIVSQAYSSGLSGRATVAQIKERFKISDNKAKLIARNEVGNLSGQFQQTLSLENGFELYEWIATFDERVRKTHFAMNGKICTWKDATVYKDSIEDTVWKSRASIGGVQLHPAMDYRCRCTSASIVNF